MNKYPPKYWLKFFRWFCNPDYVEDIEGDLIERFEKRTQDGKNARLLFARDVVQLFRPSMIRSFEGTQKLNYFGMIKHNFKVGYRNLLRKKVYSFINIGGLALGLTITILIALWVNDELTFNRNHQNIDQVARVLQEQTLNGNVITGYSVPYPLGDELDLKYGSDFDHIVMSSWFGDYVLSFGETTISKRGGFMDTDAPHLLTLDMVSGSAEEFNDQESILISESTAKALFGRDDPVGKVVMIYNEEEVIVKGVYKDLPQHSTFRRLYFIGHWDLYVNAQDWVKDARDRKIWNENSFQLFVQIAEQADMSIVSEKIKRIKYDNLPEEERIYDSKILLHPMKDWHLKSNWEDGVQKGGSIIYVWLFGIIGLFVLTLACINFMNLSTAQSERRAREVGVRKSIGSLRRQLIGQFLSESILVVSIAFLLATLLVSFAMPFFNVVAGKQIHVPLDSWQFWLTGVVFMLFIGVLAGSYPALYLSSFKPVAVLKGTYKSGLSATILRKFMVVFQFTVSVILIIGTIVVREQIKFTSERPVGYDSEGTILVEMTTDNHYKKAQVIKNELKDSKVVLDMAMASSPLTQVWNERDGLTWEGMNPDFTPLFPMNWVTHDYGKTINWEIVQGRDFSRDLSTDSTAFILNEAAVKYMGLEDPLGTKVRWGSRDYEVIGVVKDVLIESPFKPVRQTIYTIDPRDMSNFMIFRLNPNVSTLKAVSQIEKVFETHLPNVPFEFDFATDEHAKKFRSIERFGRLSGIFASLAILISCLGLFGLASFVAEQRTKEIGIRKVLGASISNLWKMLSREFVILIGISCLVAVPLSYVALTSWLQGYEYRTDLHWWIFAVATMGSIIITLITVSFQSLRAATTNPVNSLRSE